MITTDENQQNLLASAYGREMEVYAYQTNITNYMAMLAALPTTDWPANLIDYKAASVESLPFDMADADVQLITDLQFRDRLRGLVRTEKAEQSKAIRVLDAVKSQITGDYPTLLAAYKAAQPVA